MALLATLAAPQQHFTSPLHRSRRLGDEFEYSEAPSALPLLFEPTPSIQKALLPAPQPRVTIPHLYFPHIVGSVLSFCDAETLRAWRGTSRHFRSVVDRALARHLVVCHSSRRCAKPATLGWSLSSDPGRLGRSLAVETGGTHPMAVPFFAGWNEATHAAHADDVLRSPKHAPARTDYARSAVAHTRVLDLCDAVPYDGLAPLLSALRGVHTVRLRGNARQYPYSEIGARRRVVFSRASGVGPRGELFRPHAEVGDCLRGTRDQVVTLQYDPRHPHLPRMTVAPFQLGARLERLTFIFTPTRPPSPQTVYKPAEAPGLLVQLVPRAVDCIAHGVVMTVVGLEGLSPVVFGLEHREQVEDAFRAAIERAYADAHPQASREECAERAAGVRIVSARQYRDDVGEEDWAIEAEEEGDAFAPCF